MVLTTVTADFGLSWSIHDSWTELLVGTRFLLDVMGSQSRGKIEKVNLLRLTIVSSSQMTEVMFFTQLQKYVNNQSDAIKKLFEYDMNKKIAFSTAREKWPEILTGKKLDIGSEPMQSMDTLSTLRNKAVHTAEYPPVDISESAFYTAIESSKYIYNHFNIDGWDSSEYKKFVDNSPPKIKVFLRKALKYI